MCWSGEASATLATIGFAGAAYAAYKKEPPALWVCLGYFSLMEMLQAYTYTVIDECSLLSNQVATLLGFLHICFQPFFINGMSMHFIDQRIAKKIAPFVYAFCFAITIVLLVQLYPLAGAGQCHDIPICGTPLCSVSGNWHIAWLIPLNDIWMDYPTYILSAFALPILYGAWKFTTYHVLAGPLLAYMLTDNMNEWPAVWCLLSIAFLLVVIKTPIRKYLYNKAPKWTERFLVEKA